MLQALRSRSGLLLVSLLGAGMILVAVTNAGNWEVLQHVALLLYTGALALIGLKVLSGHRVQHLEKGKRRREMRGLERMLARPGRDAEQTSRSVLKVESATGVSAARVNRQDAAIENLSTQTQEVPTPVAPAASGSSQAGTENQHLPEVASGPFPHAATAGAASAAGESESKARTSDLVADFIRHRVVNAGADFNKYPKAPGHKESIVAAASDRGLEAIHSGKSVHFLLDGEPVGGMNRMTTSLASYYATQICASKHATRLVLERHGLPMARGASFAPDALSEGSAFFNRLGRDAVIKPSGGRAGMGISTGISNEEELRNAWVKARKATSRADRIVVEEQISGLDIRAFVVGGEVVAAASRVPAYVVGDGVSSIAHLLAMKTEQRTLNAYHGRTPIVVDHHYLRKMGMSEASVPAEGAVVLLNNVGNIHQGGESVDVTSSMHPELKRVAVEAVRVVPGLTLAGVDLMVTSPQEPTGAIILELNASANLSIHHYPAYGQPNDVAGSIIGAMLKRFERR